MNGTPAIAGWPAGLLCAALLLGGCCAGFVPLPPFCANQTTGVVLDMATEEPIAGAQVTFAAATASPFGEPIAIHRQVKTGRDGRFAIRHPDVVGVEMFVTAEGYHARAVPRSSFDMEVRLARPEPGGGSPGERTP